MSVENIGAVRRQQEHFSRTGEVLPEIYRSDAWTFRDSKVVRVEEYFDRAEGLEAAGLSE
jgi:ketosteroid isomerase-like protein